MATIKIESSFGKDAMAFANVSRDSEAGALNVVVETARAEQHVSDMLRARGYRWTGKHWQREQAGTDRGYGSLPLWTNATAAWTEIAILLESGCVLSTDSRTQNTLKDIEDER